MKKNSITIALAAVLFSISVAQAGEFSGGWLGGKAGYNRSDITGNIAVVGKNSTTMGLEAGYNWDVNNFLLGVNGFSDWNQKGTRQTASYGSNVYGLDAKLGLPSGNWLPYAKLGVERNRATGNVSGNGSGPHGGLGLEYKFGNHWSVAGELTRSVGKSGLQKLNNDNFTIGLNYYFNSPPAPVVVAPAPAPAPAPVIVKKEVVVPPPAPPAPVPAPLPPCKPSFTDKPVVLEGTNFETGSAKLKKSVDENMKGVVDFAVKNPDAVIAISGHTDNVGTVASNQKLSEKRAESVKAYLVNKKIAANRISTKGEAFYRPVAGNKTSEGRAKNRRVEIASSVKERKDCKK